jgi:hypothetical protein
VLATGSTDANGDYSLTVPTGQNVFVRAVAQMLRDASQPLPRWNFEVRDLPATTPLTLPFPSVYTFDGPGFSSGAAGAQNVQVPSGVSSNGQVIGTRASAPFAILDTVYRAYNTVLSVEPSANFAPLIIDWGTTNAAGQTFFTTARVTGQTARQAMIVLTADPNADTDEFDAHVIAHEFGHYVEEFFSRADSIGGPHRGGDQLDMRLAFGEGYGYAFGAIVLGDPVARDSFVQSGMQRDSVLDVEQLSAVTNPGWYSEASNWAILWDLYDTTNEPGDTLSLGLGPLWSVLTSPQRNTDALTSVFTFVTALKQQRPADAAAIDQIVSQQATVSSTINAFGTTETNSGTPANANVLPIYTPITINGASVTLNSIGDFQVGANRSGGNKLSTRRFLRLDVPMAQTVRIRLTAPAGRDADIIILRQGAFVAQGIANGNEDFTQALQAGTHILEVYDCENAECSDAASYNYAVVPITVTVSTN